MKNIRELRTTQIRIFPTDEIHFQSLQRQTAINKIKEKYKLKNIITPTIPEIPSIEIQKILIFTNGEFVYKNKTYLVDRLVIENRRIIITMASHSEIADEFYTDLRNLLIELDLRDAKSNYNALVKSEETTCVAKLDFYLYQLFERNFINNFQQTLLNKIESHGCKIEIVPNVVRFKINYLNEPELYRKNKITFADKEFILEVRERTSYEDRIYFTSSPTDTKTHLELLSEINNLIAKK